jgi:ribosomal protein S27E
MALQASCPACGAQVLFKTGSSVVVVCESCNSVVARTDRGIEDAGKVADVVESGSPLEVGLRGVYLGVAFELTGRAQLGHAAGGFWDEWYAAFADGRWGWLAEAQGRFYLTFQIQVPAPNALPSFDSLQLGQPVWAIPAQTPPVVAEKGTAQALAAEGEIPYLLRPGETTPTFPGRAGPSPRSTTANVPRSSSRGARSRSTNSDSRARAGRQSASRRRSPRRS